MYDGLEALYRRHVGEVYLYAYSLCKNPDQAQDLSLIHISEPTRH